MILKLYSFARILIHLILRLLAILQDTAQWPRKKLALILGREAGIQNDTV